MTAHGSYVLTVACDSKLARNCRRVAVFEGKSASVARRLAREAGWTIHDRGGRVMCAKCRVIDVVEGL